MKKLICSLLILGLALLVLSVSYAQDTDLDTLRAADVNADGVVNILDLTLVAAHFGKTLAADQAPNPDVNGDGAVNVLDLTLVASHLGKTVPTRPPVAFVSANPTVDSQLAVDDTITLTFDNPPEDVTVSTGETTITDKTVTITGPFTPGALALTITWTDGTQTLNYTVPTPDTEAPNVLGGTLSDGNTDVDPEAINSSGQIVVEFNESVSGTIALQTESGDDVGWLGKVEGNTAILDLIRGKEIGNETTYVIAGKIRDAVGNETDLSITFTTIRAPVAFVRANPAAKSQLEVDDTITLTFDNMPENVTVSTGTATTTDKTVTITGPFDPGALALTVTWADGTQTLNYTIRPPAVFVRARPASGATIDVDDTITLTFDERPRDVKVSTGTARTTGKSVRISGPFDSGSLELTITWTDGDQTLTYTVRTPDTERPKITSSTVTAGKKDVDPEKVNSSRRIEVKFNESVSGTIALRTQSGADVGWLGKVEGNTATLTLVAGKEIDNGTSYVIRGKVSDAAGNSTDINISFTTASKATGIPFEVTDATFNTLVLQSEVPVLLEYIKDG